MNILVVEDDIASQARMTNFLEKLGHQVQECDNGQEALELFHCQEFHLVLSDIKMPKLSGLDLLKKLKSLPKRNHFEVILFTGHGDVELAIEALRAGAYDYLLKPINLEELLSVTEHVAESLALPRENELLSNRFNEMIKQTSQEKDQELNRLKKAYAKAVGVKNIVIFSDKLRAVFNMCDKFHADRTIPILIQGETGTGKEIIAKYIHYGKNGTEEPFVAINCATIPANIFESEIFGYEAGSFTGALPRGHKGKLDLAKGGTLFLDEITELPIDMQAKLLRVLEEKEFYRVGGLKRIKTDVRFIFATNMDIVEKVHGGSFRMDLYYRINVGKVLVPPLRERTEDIIPLATIFLQEMSKQRGKNFVSISDLAKKTLLSYRWPGNIRELKNTLELVTVLYDDNELQEHHLSLIDNMGGYLIDNQQPQVINPENFLLPADRLDIEQYIDNIFIHAYDKHDGNKTKTAEYLGVSWRTLDYRIRQITERNKGI